MGAIKDNISVRSGQDLCPQMFTNLYDGQVQKDRDERLNKLHLPFVWGQNDLRFACPYFILELMLLFPSRLLSFLVKKARQSTSEHSFDNTSKLKKYFRVLELLKVHFHFYEAENKFKLGENKSKNSFKVTKKVKFHFAKASLRIAYKNQKVIFFTSIYI